MRRNGLVCLVGLAIVGGTLCPVAPVAAQEAFIAVLERWRKVSALAPKKADDQPASSMSKFSASVNSDIGNGSFWLEIRGAKHVDRCS